MTSAGAIKFYANHLYPGRCPLRSSRFSTPTFRSVNHFSHPFFNETETQKHQKLSRDVFVLMHTAHTCTHYGCLFFFFHFYIPRLALSDKTRKWRKGKGCASRSFERELSKKKARNWIHFGDGFKFDERLERELTNNFSLFHLII